MKLVATDPIVLVVIFQAAPVIFDRERTTCSKFDLDGVEHDDRPDRLDFRIQENPT